MDTAQFCTIASHFTPDEYGGFRVTAPIPKGGQIVGVYGNGDKLMEIGLVVITNDDDNNTNNIGMDDRKFLLIGSRASTSADSLMYIGEVKSMTETRGRQTYDSGGRIEYYHSSSSTPSVSTFVFEESTN